MRTAEPLLTTRRNAFAIGAFAPVAISDPFARDADLVRRCSAFVAASRDCDALLAPHQQTLSGELPTADLARYYELCRIVDDLRDAIAATPAITTKGLVAKAKALQIDLGDPLDQDSLCDGIARSLVVDILRREGV